jgi:uncharacterized protein (DUF1778 family)
MRFSDNSITAFLLFKQMTGLAVLERQERIVLSDRDSARVLALLDNPRKPSPALLAAARRHVSRQPK